MEPGSTRAVHGWTSALRRRGARVVIALLFPFVLLALGTGSAAAQTGGFSASCNAKEYGGSAGYGLLVYGPNASINTSGMQPLAGQNTTYYSILERLYSSSTGQWTTLSNPYFSFWSNRDPYTVLIEPDNTVRLGTGWYAAYATVYAWNGTGYTGPSTVRLRFTQGFNVSADGLWCKGK